jgi:hypothetical protein
LLEESAVTEENLRKREEAVEQSEEDLKVKFERIERFQQMFDTDQQ